MVSVHVSNIGWTSTLSGVADPLRYKTDFYPKSSKVLAMPGGHEFRPIEATVDLLDFEKHFFDTILPGDAGNTTVLLQKVWAWAEPSVCDSFTLIVNPWACNFISLSNCTDSDIVLKSITNEEVATGKISSTLSNRQEQMNALRTIIENFRNHYPEPIKSQNYGYSDGKFLKAVGFDRTYDYSQFVTKGATLMAGATESNSIGFDEKTYDSSKFPAINDVKDLFSDAPTSLSNSDWHRVIAFAFASRPNYLLRSYIKESIQNIRRVEKKNERKVLFPYPNQLPGPCLSLHVRHGDGPSDSRGKTYAYIDRSLDGHMRSAIPIIDQLGITTIFIASDNASVVEEAPKKYPQYQWYTQHRPIKDFSHHMFEMHNENNIQKELAHIIADLQISATCSGLVGSFDSAFATLMYFYGCQLNSNGMCQPSVDLRSDHKPK